MKLFNIGSVVERNQPTEIDMTTNSKKPLYLSDVLAAKNKVAEAEAIKYAKQDAKQAKYKVAADLHPAIGVLMTAKGVKYYAFVNGQYREGSVDALTSALNAVA
jgi:hypothetical protein